MNKRGVQKYGMRALRKKLENCSYEQVISHVGKHWEEEHFHSFFRDFVIPELYDDMPLFKNDWKVTFIEEYFGPEERALREVTDSFSWPEFYPKNIQPEESLPRKSRYLVNCFFDLRDI